MIRKQLNFDRINKGDFRRNIHDNFPSSYRILISIIQGVAFGILMVKGAQIIQDDNISNTLLVFPAMSLFGIVLVFYFYNWFVTITYIPPTLIQSGIPIILATFQTLPMFFFDDPESWWLYTAIFALFGALTFLNTLMQLREDIYGSGFFHDIYKKLQKELIIDILFCIFLSIIAFLSWCIYPSGYDNSEVLTVHDRIFVPILVLFMLGMGMVSSYWFLPKVMELGGLIRNKE